MAKSMRTTVLMAVALAAVACGAGPEPSTDDATTTTIAGTTSTGAETTTMPQLDPDQNAMVESAKSDLARRLGVETADLTVVSFKDVTWPDGSLGCPEEGKLYTQALVEGYQILLRHEVRFFDYHGVDGEEPFLCESDEKDGGYEFLPPPGFD